MQINAMSMVYIQIDKYNVNLDLEALIYKMTMSFELNKIMK